MLANRVYRSKFDKIVPAQKKSLGFEPESGVADALHRLKFVTADPGNAGFFMLDNMQEAYEETPAFIAGSYFLKSKKIAVKLALVRSRKRYK